MQFSIRDLLLLTTIAAIYAAFVGALVSRGLLDNQVNLFPAIVAILLLLAPRFYDFIGQESPLVSFQQKGSYWYHAGPICLIGLIVDLAINNKHALPLSTSVLVILVLYHIYIQIWNRIVITPNGMGPQFDILLWENHRFDMDTNSSSVRITALSQASKKWGHPSTFVAIPAEHLEEVRAILEAKQGAAEE